MAEKGNSTKAEAPKPDIEEDSKIQKSGEVTPTEHTSEGAKESAVEGATGVQQSEEAAGTSSWGGWFSSTLSSAKEKSTEMYQYIKQDLTEFGESVQEVSRDLKDKLKLEDTVRSATCTVGDTMNTIFDQVSTIFGVGPDDDDETILVGDANSMNNRRVQNKIYALALEEHVFLEDPSNMEDYESWAASFDLNEKSVELADLLTTNPHLQLQYTQLVPDKVSHLLFWHRFYYQVYLILKAENQFELTSGKKSEKLEQNEDALGRESPDDKNDQSLGADIVEISEEDQKRLLTEYEEEMKKGHSRGSSGTHLSSSSSGSFAFVSHDLLTDEVKVD